jgi:transmembrane sensor
MRRNQPRYDAAIAKEAADWVAALVSTPSRRTAAAVRKWVLRSPEHCREFIVAAGIYKVIQRLPSFRTVDVEALVAEANVVVSLPGRHECPAGNDLPSIGTCQPPCGVPSNQSSRLQCTTLSRQRQVILRAAAAVLVFALPVLGDGLKTSAAQQQYATTSKTRTISLDGGTVIYLNADSGLRVIHTPHAVTVLLEKGEALFDVHHAPHSSDQLWVIFDGMRLRDIGTRFDVQKQPDKILVSVLQGRVCVYSGSPDGLTSDPLRSEGDAGECLSVLAAAGHEIEIQRTGVFPESHIRVQARAGLERRTAWVYGWLDFNGETLSQAAYEFSRHDDRQVLVTDPSIAELRVGGRFRADDLNTWLDALPYLGVCVERNSDPKEHNTVRLSKAKMEIDPTVSREGGAKALCD